MGRRRYEDSIIREQIPHEVRLKIQPISKRFQLCYGQISVELEFEPAELENDTFEFGFWSGSKCIEIIWNFPL